VWPLVGSILIKATLAELEKSNEIKMRALELRETYNRGENVSGTSAKETDDDLINKIKAVRLGDPKAGTFKWGMKPEEVMAQARTAVEAKYEQRIDKARQDPGLQQRIRDEMALAANSVIEMGGGIAVVQDGRVTARIAYPVAGLLSDKSPAEVAAAHHAGGAAPGLELGARALDVVGLDRELDDGEVVAELAKAEREVEHGDVEGEAEERVEAIERDEHGAAGQRRHQHRDRPDDPGVALLAGVEVACRPLHPAIARIDPDISTGS
jgi:hypothetical protein